MLPKTIRDKKQDAKKAQVELKKILKRMDDYINSSNAQAISMAEAFYHVIGFHIEYGDLKPENVHLAALLRRNND